MNTPHFTLVARYLHWDGSVSTRPATLATIRECRGILLESTLRLVNTLRVSNNGHFVAPILPARTQSR